MKRGAKRVAGAVALMVLTGGVVQSWKNFRALKEAREKLAQEESAEAELRRQVAATEAMLAKSSARANELAADLRKIDEDQRKAAGAGKATGGGAKPRSLNVAHVIRHEPEAQMWFLEKQRGEMTVFYGPLFRQLGWGREKREAFIANVLARNEKWMDLDNLAHDDGDPEAIAKLRREASEAYDAAQRALLGAEGARRWEQYERTAGIRNMVSTLAGVAAGERADHGGAGRRGGAGDRGGQRRVSEGRTGADGVGRLDGGRGGAAEGVFPETAGDYADEGSGADIGRAGAELSLCGDSAGEPARAERRGRHGRVGRETLGASSA